MQTRFGKFFLSLIALPKSVQHQSAQTCSFKIGVLDIRDQVVVKHRVSQTPAP